MMFQKDLQGLAIALVDRGTTILLASAFRLVHYLVSVALHDCITILPSLRIHLSTVLQ